ncbi:MAG: hypothetical protein R2813_14145, partial [Flavobacteriales bacterium]
MLFVRFVSVGLVGWLNRSSISMVALTVSFVIIASSCSDSEQSSNHNKRSASEVNTSSANIAVDNQRYALNQDNLNTEIKVKLKEYSDKLQSEGQV